MENVMRRLVYVPEPVIKGTEEDNADAIFEHDGYVDHSAWIHVYVDMELEKKNARIWRVVTQDQMKHPEITEVVNNEDIFCFSTICVAKLKVARPRRGLILRP